MKKMRVLASLLCIMMVVCSISVMPVSAAVGDLDASIAAILGADAAKVVYEQEISADFSSADVYSSATATTYEADGVKIGSGAQVWSVAPTQDFWTEKNAVVMKLKLGQDANDRLTIFTEAGTRKNVKKEAGEAQSRGKVMLADGVIYAGSKSLPGSMNDAFFRPGYDWLEVMVVHNDENFDVYVKNNPADSSACNTTNGAWVKLSFAEELLYEQGHSGATKDEHFYIAQAASTDTKTYGSDENPAYLKSVKVYHGGVAIDTIQEVLQDGVAKSGATAGDTVAKVKTDDLYATTHDWNFANSTMETYFRSGNGSLAMPEGAEITAEGLDLSGTNGEGEWKYMPHSHWSFVNAGAGSTTIFRAGYVKVKGNVTIKFTGADHKRVNVVASVPGSTLTTNEGEATKTHSFTPDNEWVEYVFVERNGNTANIYAKKATDAVWTYAGYTGVPTKLSADDPGLKFSGTGVVALWKTIEFNENGYSASYPDTKVIATDSETIPATANTLIYGAEFDVAPSNAVLGKAATVANGVLDTKATVENAELGTVHAEGTMKISGMYIPVGGYAEFKAKGNGRIEATFDDGTNKFYYNRLPADNYAIQGTAIGTLGNYVNDSDMAWRTYLVVRTAEGYSFYSKAEGDTGWKIQGTAAEASKLASDGEGAYISFRFHTNCDGVSVGNGQMDYLRIYGTQADLEAMNGYTIESALGVTTAKNTYNVQVDATTGSREDVAFHDSDSYADGTYTADGVALASGDKATLWGVNPITNYWSVKNATVIKAKLGTEDDTLYIYGTGLTDGTRFNYKIAKDQVNHQVGELTTIGWINGDNTSSDRVRFTPGTDWFELMIVEEATQQKFYGKNAQTNNVWSYLGTVNGYETNASSYPVYAIGTSKNAESPTLVKSVMVYRDDNGMTDPEFGSEEPGGSGGEGQEPEVDAIDTIQEVLQDGVSRSRAEQGDTVAKVKTDDLYATTHDWNFANSTMETYSRSGNGSLAMPEGAEITAEGLDLSGTNGEVEWKYLPHSNWSFVNAAGSTTLFRAGYVKVKGNVTIKFTGSDHKRVNVVTSVPGSALTTNEGETTKTHSFTPDDEWVEYVFVERNGNTANIYAKKATDTVWTYVSYTGTPTKLSANDPGLKFSGTGVVALWKTIEFNENGYTASYPDVKLIATNAEVTPADTGVLYFGEEFDTVPTYRNPSLQFGPAADLEDGVLKATTTPKNEALGTELVEGYVRFNKIAIPVGGYAEYKIKSDGRYEVTFDDGTNKFFMNRLPADNYSFQGTSIATFANFVNDSDMAWRIYRLIRTNEGYSLYSQAEGDTGWRIMGIASEESKIASDGSDPYIKFRFLANCDETTAGNGQLDYLRIYSNQPFDDGEEDEGEQPDQQAMNTIEAALSSYVGNVTMTASSNAWKFANSTMTSYSRAGGIQTPDNAKFTDEGLDLSETNGTDAWRFTAFEGWAPASYANTSTSYRALYLKVKGNVTTTILMSDNQYIDKLRSVPGEKLSVSNAVGADGTTKNYRTSDGFSGDPQIDDNWVEYLIVPRNSNATYVFAKSDTLTDGKWVKAIGIDGYTYTPSSEAKATDYNEKYGASVVYDEAAYAEQRKTGISFSGTGVVAEWKTIDYNNAARTTVASDDEVKPEGADALWFVEEFSAAPSYNPAPAFGNACSLEDGALVTNATYGNEEEGIEATTGYVRFDDITIPVGGYAEFRMRSNGLKKLVFDDGVSKWETTLNCDYSAFPGTTAVGGGYVSDSDVSWRTWRFVRSENGYSVYSKADGDTGWRIHSIDGMNENAESTGATIRIQFYANADGVSEGNGQLDYLRIYGATPDAPLTLIDGNNMTPITDGAYLENPWYVRVIPGNGITSGKILVGNYDGKILKNLQILNVSELNEETVLNVFNDMYNTVKVFLWDDINGNMKGLSDIMNLTF